MSVSRPWLGLLVGLYACESSASDAERADAASPAAQTDAGIRANPRAGDSDDDDAGATLDGDNDGDTQRDGDAPVPFGPIEEDGLPVLQLTTAPNINDAEHTPAQLVYRGRSYRGVQAKYRGSTSQTYPKKSFTIKFSKADPFNDPERGFDDKQRIVLTSTFDDNSYLRQRLAYELWNLLQPQVPVHIYHAVLYLNGQYHGLYLVGDHVDDELMAANGLWSGGNLYKARTHDANLRLEDRDGGVKEALDLGYTKEEGEPEAGEDGAFDDLHILVNWIASAPDDTFLKELPIRLDQKDFEDWLLLVSVIDGRDSAGKNGYLYHDPRLEAPDLRWHYVPWDFNASFGQNWRTVHIVSGDPLEFYDGQNALFERYARMPELHERIAGRYAGALAGEWSLASVLALFDAHAQEIDAAARRDEEMWGQIMRDFDWGERKTEFSSYDQEREFLRSWIEERWALVHAQYP